jgi:hypothetical protein
MAKVRKAWLPSTSPVDDVHRRLRSAASSYRRATDEDNT